MSAEPLKPGVGPRVKWGLSFQLVKEKGQAGPGPRAAEATWPQAHIWPMVLPYSLRSFRIAAGETVDLLT